MYYNPCFKNVVLFSCIFSISTTCHAEAFHISLKKAMAAKLVTVNAVSNGGYCAKSISLDLTNNSTKDLAVDVDPALIFKPEDTGYQNLVLLGNETIALAPREKKEVSLQTFCGKSYGHSPAKNLCYNYWKQGDNDMIQALCYVKDNNIDLSLAQRAVWMFTNGYCLNSIYTSDHSRMSETFVKYLASLRNIVMPEYFMEYKIDTALGNRTTYTRDAKVYVTMHWNDDGYYRHMYLWIYKANGDLYKKIEADQVIDKYGVTVKVEFDPKRDLKGAYIVQLHDDANKIWDQKRVIVGMSACDMI